MDFLKNVFAANRKYTALFNYRIFITLFFLKNHSKSQRAILDHFNVLNFLVEENNKILLP